MNSTRIVLIIIGCVILAFFAGRKSTILFKGFTVRGAVSPEETIADKPMDTVAYRYTDNLSYHKTLERHMMYKGQYKVVMLGNSMVSRVAWNELLGRSDIANRGIGGDIAEGLYNRLQTVYDCKPELCFVESGINDIRKGVPLADYAYFMGAITDSLLEHKIEPVVMHILYVNRGFPGADSLNRVVDRYNERIAELARGKGIRSSDLNSKLSPLGYLDDAYADEDKLHLNNAAYKIWGQKMMAYL